MRKLATIIFVFLSVCVYAQRVKYRDLVINLPTLSPEQQKNQLKEYVGVDLDHPNANFRLALLYERNYRTADPLTAFAFTMANAEQARNRYLKAGQLCDSREVERNNEYYAPIFKTFDEKGRPSVPFATVSAKITNGYDSAGMFLDKMPSIYKAFTRSVNSYDQAVKVFALINVTYANPEDLYMLYDKDLDKLFTDLKSSYDTCIASLTQYLKLTQAYPLKSHQQTFSVKPIETYHLDGLITHLTFLTPAIELWDYGSWVDKTRKVVQTDIAELRKRLSATNDHLDETLRKISTASDTQMPPLTVIDKQVAFTLNNFDRQSVIQSLIDYKAFKEQWDIESRSKVLDTTLSSHNAAVYSSLIYANRKADTLLQELKTRVTPAHMSKHKELIAKMYGGPAGLEKFARDQEQHVKETFNEYSRELRSNVSGFSGGNAFTNKDNFLKSGKLTVPLIVASSTPEGLDQGLLFTQFNQKNSDGSAYVAGVYKPDKKKNLISTYLLRINPDGKVAWLKDFTLAVDSAAKDDANSQPGPIVLTQEGCALMVRSVHVTRGDAQNHFIYLNEKGEDKIRLRLKEKAFPRFLLYSEKSNQFVLTFKGMEIQQQFATSENVTTLGVNVLGQEVWRRDIPLKGTITDVISLADGYMLAGNFTEIKNISGQEIRTKTSSSDCNPYLVRLGERGDVIHITPVLSANSVYLTRLVKVNDNSINLIAYSETLDKGLSKTFSESDQMIHVMSNRQGQIVCTTY
jgi:hypothetical protein